MSEVLRPLFRPDVNLGKMASAGKPLRLDWLALDLLRVDPKFQREITRRGLATIVKIANEFSWARFSPVMVAPVSGTALFSIIDGQHRCTAALLRGFDKVPCAIGEANAMEQARIFAAVNGNVTPMTVYQLFKAARAAGEDWAKAIDRVCGAAGLEALSYPKSASEIMPYQTIAIGTLKQAIMRFGEAEVSAALKAARGHAGMEQPGAWNAAAIKLAVEDYRISIAARAKPAASGVSISDRIRELKARGHGRFAIQSALRVSLAEIEAVFSEDKA